MITIEHPRSTRTGTSTTSVHERHIWATGRPRYRCPVPGWMHSKEPAKRNNARRSEQQRRQVESCVFWPNRGGCSPQQVDVALSFLLLAMVFPIENWTRVNDNWHKCCLQSAFNVPLLLTLNIVFNFRIDTVTVCG